MPKSSKKSFNYESTLTEVESIINQIEDGKLSLEEVFEQFAIATTKLKDCEQFLQIGQEKMEMLIEILEDDSEEMEF